MTDRSSSFDQPIAQSGFFQAEGHGIDGVCRDQRDDGFLLDIAEESDLVEDVFIDGIIAAQGDHVGLDTDAAQFAHAVLCRFCLQFLAGGQVGQPGDVNVERIVAAHVLAHLADGFKKGQTLDIANGAADLDQDHVGAGGASHQSDPALDLVGDVRNHLDGAAQIVAASFLVEDIVVDLAAGDIAIAG